MKIIFNEIKKVFQLKMIILLAIISLIFYCLFISFYIDYFPNGRPALDTYNIFVEMIEEYGEFMDEYEFLDFKTVYKKEVEKADQYLKSNDESIKAGITTYDKFIDSYDEFLYSNPDSRGKELEDLHSYIMFKEKVDLFWELETREHIIDRYEERKYIEKSLGIINEKQEIRLQEIIDSGNINSIFPSLVFENYMDLIRRVLALILVSIIFMISPIFIRDRINKINYLQNTSKVGRKLFKKKIVAGLISSFIIISLHLIFMFSIYSFNNIEIFFNVNINSVFNEFIFWYDFTFIQYIALTVIAVYILGFIMTLIVAFVSSIAPNYITVIGIQVPIAFIFLSIVSEYLIDRLTMIHLPKQFLPMAYFILTAIGMVLIVVRWKREKILDIVN